MLNTTKEKLELYTNMDNINSTFVNASSIFNKLPFALLVFISLPIETQQTILRKLLITLLSYEKTTTLDAPKLKYLSQQLSTDELAEITNKKPIPRIEAPQLINIEDVFNDNLKRLYSFYIRSYLTDINSDIVVEIYKHLNLPIIGNEFSEVLQLVDIQSLALEFMQISAPIAYETIITHNKVYLLNITSK